MGSIPQRVLQFGRETTFGTLVPATAIMSGVEDFNWDPGIVMKMMTVLDGTQASNHKAIKIAESPVANVTGIFSPEDSLYWLDSGFNLGVVTGVGPYVNTYSAPVTTTAQATRSRTLEFYDGQQCYRLTSGLVNAFSIMGADNDIWKFSTSWFGTQITSGTLTAALSGRTWNGFPTNSTSVWVDDLGGTIGTTALAATLINWNLSVTTGIHGKFFQNGTLLQSAKGINNLVGTLTMTLEANASGVAEMAKLLSGTGRLVRLKSATVNTALAQIDFCGTYTKNSAAWGNRNGNTTLSLTLTSTMDTGAFANWLKIVITNIAAMVATA